MANPSGGSSDEYETDDYYGPDRESDDDLKESGNSRRTFPTSLTAGGGNRARRRNSSQARVDHEGGMDKDGGNSHMQAIKPKPAKKVAKHDTNMSKSDVGAHSTDKESAQKYSLGTMVSKMFDTGAFSGKVVDYHAKERHYTVRYEDGDEEDYSEDELKEILGQEKRDVDAHEMTKNDCKEEESDDSLCDDVKMQATRSSDDDDIDDSDSDDPFSHLGRSISNKRKVLELSSDEEDSDGESDTFYGGSRRNKSGDKIEKKIAVYSSDSQNSDDDYFTKRKPNVAVAKAAASAKRKATTKRSELDSSSDSDVELITSPCTMAKKPAASKVTSFGTKTPATTGNYSNGGVGKELKTSLAAKNPSPRLPSKTLQHNPSVRADSERALEQVKAAKAALLRAQGYHAEELEVKLPALEPKRLDPTLSENVLDVDDDSIVEALAAAPKELTCSGNVIQLSLRYQDASKKDCNVSLRIKTDEPLKNLSERFQAQYGGLISSLKFDGQKLDMNKTPQFYEMEDEDLVDAVVQSSGGTITIYVRRNGSSLPHEFKMSNMIPLSKLVSSYCTNHKLPSIDLEYNGRRLDPSKSCRLEGIPNNAYLDAIVSETSTGGQTISLAFRVNGDSNDVHSVNVLQSGSFKSAMIAFAQRKNCSLTACKFIFDGEVLQPTTTVESLDLEGGEIIDVKITANAVATPPLQDDDCDVIMTDAAAAVISVKTCRNLAKTKPKTWKLSNTHTFSELKADYISYYKSKGCKTVKFYFRNTVISAESKSFLDLGISDGDVIYAMENGKSYKQVI